MDKTPRSTLALLLPSFALILLLSGAAAFAAQDQPQSSAPADPAAGAPKISFPESSFDFGTVPRGSINEHIFKVRNVGTAPLKLIKAQAG